MKLRSIRQVKNLQGKTVLLRVDFNVPIARGRVDEAEAFRLERVLPTILFLLSRGARVVLLSHRGRPEGHVVDALALLPVVKKLQSLLQKKRADLGRNTRDAFSPLKDLPELADLFPLYTILPGRLFMLRNLRFDAREEGNNKKFAKALSLLGDLYVNDAFAVSHRKNASVHAITKYLPSYAGLLLEEEVRTLASIWEHPKRPLIVLLGGAKISTKIGLVQKFLQSADQVLLGGGLANTVFHLRGYEMGRSLIEHDVARDTTMLLGNHAQLHLPMDVVVAKRGHDHARVVEPEKLTRQESIFDIGPKTVKLYTEYIREAKMILWNGPVGLVEVKRFSHGTEHLLRAIAASSATSIVGGGESVQVLRQFHLEKKMSFVSTGGGAMLEFLEKGTLPGIEPLRV